MGVGKYFGRKKKVSPTPPAGPAPVPADESEESDELLHGLAQRPAGDVTIDGGRVSASDESFEDEASSDRVLGGSAELSDADLKDLAAKARKPLYGQTPTLQGMSRRVRDSMTHDEIKRGRASKSTLYRLMVALDEFSASRHPVLQLPLAQRVGRLAESYTNKHRNSRKDEVRARLAIMADIDQLASVHILRIHAEMAYARDVMGSGLSPRERTARAAADKKAGRKPGAGGRVQEFRYLSNGTEVREETEAWGAVPEHPEYIQDAGVTDPMTSPNARLATLAGGLSHAEVLAIRVYTAENYTYMNAAVSNWKGGLEKHLDHRANADTTRDLRQEGTAHAGPAMSGLAKLPAWNGTTYRGDNLSLDRMRQLYTPGNTVTNVAFLSTSKTTATAHQFLRTSGTGPVQVMVEVEIAGKGGRDVSMYSTSAREKEVIVVPGATYETLSVESYDLETKTRSPAGAIDDRRRPNGGLPVYWVTVRQTG